MYYNSSALKDDRAARLAMYLAIGLRLREMKDISLTDIVEGALRAVRYGDRESEYRKASPRVPRVHRLHLTSCAGHGVMCHDKAKGGHFYGGRETEGYRKGTKRSSQAN